MRSLQEPLPELLSALDVPTPPSVNSMAARLLRTDADRLVAPMPAPVDLSGNTLLIVDDDRINLRILGGILKREAYRIIETDTAEKALDIYARERPDLVLLDVVLPGLNGFDACRLLKAAYGPACAPILFITAKHESADIVEGLEAGGSDYLQKPFKDKEVAARIRVHLQNRVLFQQLSQANEAKNRFLGMAAHDLRNPLASIRGFAEFLRDGVMGPLSKDQADVVETIHSASEGMLALVNDLLDVATIEAGQLRMARERCDVAELVHKAVRVAALEAASKDTTITISRGEGGRDVQVDPAKLRQVVDNLLSNAVKYSPRASVVRVEVEDDGQCVRLSVFDQGPGIPDSERGRLFKDFGKLSAKPTGGEKSTGLGLAICRKIVEAHQGIISAENLPEGGCEFRVILPRCP